MTRELPRRDLYDGDVTLLADVPPRCQLKLFCRLSESIVVYRAPLPIVVKRRKFKLQGKLPLELCAMSRALT